jgi:uncharacterized protein with ParB-like and HNH nuclease domain
MAEGKTVHTVLGPFIRRIAHAETRRSITGKWPALQDTSAKPISPSGKDASEKSSDLTDRRPIPHLPTPTLGTEPITTPAFEEKEPNMQDESREQIQQVRISASQEIETKKVNINKLFSDFWFSIPEYQRSYKWGSEEIDELLDDIRHAQQTTKDKEYFLGSVVLQRHIRSSGSLKYTCYDVLDGQQRLTTLLIMMAVLRDLTTNDQLKAHAAEAVYQEQNEFENQPERIRIEFLIRDEVGDFVDTFLKPELGTGQQDLLEQYQEKPNVSVSNMAKATLYLRRWLGKLPAEELKQFAVFLFNRVIVIYVAAESLEDAFRLFTILNNRGLPLTNSDILKSMNIGAVQPQQKRQHYAKLWEEEEGQFGPDEFDRFLGHLRTILVKEKARENLLKEFENLYKGGKLEKGEKTLRMVKTYRDHYASLIWFENEALDGDCRFRNVIAVMKEDLSTDWIPPLLYFVERFGRQQAFLFLTRLESKFVADWILQQSPTTRISSMNAILRAVEGAKTAEDVVVNDPLFQYDRESVRQAIDGPIYGKSFGRYLMLRVEYQLMDRLQPFPTFNRISVEHVLPQQPKDGSKWLADFTPDNRAYWTDRIANLVLLSRIKNSELGRLDFADKKQKYFKSSVNVFPNVVRVMQKDEWTPAVLEKRQAEVVGSLMEQFK